MKQLAVFAGVMLMAAGVAMGGGVNLEDIGSDAVWVAHVDFAAVRGSAVGQSLMKGKQWTKFAAKMAVLKDRIGIDLAKDLKTATLYGSDYGEQNNVVLIRGAMDIPKMKALISMLKDYKENETDGGIVYSWTDEKKNKPVACAFRGTDTAVVAGSVQLVSDAVAVLDRRAKSITDESGLRLPEPHEGAFLSFGAVAHDGRIGWRKDSVMAGQADWVAFGVGERDDKVQMTMAVGAKTDEAATQIEQILLGFRALALMSEDIAPEARQTLSSAAVTRSGNAVSVSLSGKVEVITKAIQDGCKRNAMRRKHRDSGGDTGTESDDAPAAQ